MNETTMRRKVSRGHAVGRARSAVRWVLFDDQ